MNTTFHIPELFFPEKVADTNIKFYTTPVSSFKNKVIFSQNMLCFILEGKKAIYDPCSSNSYDRSQLVLLNGGTKLMSENVSETGLYKSILLFYSNEFLRNFCIEYHISPESAGPKDSAIHSINKDAMLENFQSSLLTLNDSNTLSQSLQTIKFTELLLYLYHSPSYKIPFLHFLQGAMEHTKHIEFKTFIHLHEENNLALEELAFLSGKSLSSFKRLFNKNFGTSPGKYFLQHRMNKAKRLLASGKLISEVAWEIGYETTSAFSNEFRKSFGITPSGFIKTTTTKE